MDFEIIGNINIQKRLLVAWRLESYQGFAKFMGKAIGVSAKVLQPFVYKMDLFAKLKFTGMRLRASASVNSKLSVILTHGHE